jgi:DNA-binding winged helix-turn-helix (wHTH) protein
MNDNASEASYEKKMVLRQVLLQHQGQGKAVKKRDLIVALWGEEAARDESYNSRYDRSLRGMIEAINQEGGLVCSSPKHGYWWASSLEDGLPAAESLKGRALTQLENANRLVENIKAEFGGQLRLV